MWRDSCNPIHVEIRYFNRDVECIRTFFRRRFQYESALYPRFRKVLAEDSEDGDNFRLDVVVAASGFGHKDQKILEEVRILGVDVFVTKFRFSVHGDSHE